MQLHQLAAVVLVEALRRILALWRLPDPRGLDAASAERPAHDPRRDHLRVRPVRVRAHPVVEIEEHRGTLRVRVEQIAKLAEDVRADDVALVLREHEARGTLPRIHVEVVEPEIGEHFLELPLAVHGAEHLLLPQLDDHAVRLLLLALSELRALYRVERLLPLPPRLDLRHLVRLRDLSRAHRQRPQPGQAGRDRAVRNALRMELLIDVAPDAHRADSRDVARPRTKADAVQDMADRPVVAWNRRCARQPAGAGKDGENGDENDGPARHGCHLLMCRLDPV